MCALFYALISRVSVRGAGNLRCWLWLLSTERPRGDQLVLLRGQGTARPRSAPRSPRHQKVEGGTARYGAITIW